MGLYKLKGNNVVKKRNIHCKAKICDIKTAIVSEHQVQKKHIMERIKMTWINIQLGVLLLYAQ